MENIIKNYPPAFRIKDGDVIIVCHKCNAVLDKGTCNGICPWCEEHVLTTDIKIVKLISE